MSVGATRGTDSSSADTPLLDNTLKILMKCLEMASTSSKLHLSDRTSSCSEKFSDENTWPHDQHAVSEDTPAGAIPGPDRIKIVEYKDESQMADIMRLITKDLSEPYSIYTYRYFINNWPNLCLLALDTTTDQYVGVIVCKMDEFIVNRSPKQRGYIAMLAVDESYRRMRIGTRLVRRAIEMMVQNKCSVVMLETEVTNVTAQRLYCNLGFIKEKRLFRYYLNGVDAFRLKLYFDPPIHVPSQPWAQQEEVN